MKKTITAFDYETTGLKPHAKGQEILCIAVSNGERTVAMMMQDGMRGTLRGYLKSPSTKIAANMKFEEAWSRVILNCPVENWHFDTMLAQHFLDSREGITGLKFQAYVRMG